MTPSRSADCDDVAGRAPQHLARLFAHGKKLLRILFYGYDRGLAQYDAPVPDIDQHAGCAQVDSNIL